MRRVVVVGTSGSGKTTLARFQPLILARADTLVRLRSPREAVRFLAGV